MAYVTNIPIARLRIYERWTAAPLGTFLQICPPSGVPVMGMLSKHPDIDPRLLLGLDGSDVGRLLGPEALGHGCGIDVSHFVDLFLTDPAPVPSSDPAMRVGFLYAEMGIVSMWSQIPESNAPQIRVPLNGDNKGIGSPEAEGAVLVGGLSVRFRETPAYESDESGKLTRR